MGLGDGRGCSDGPMLKDQALTTDRAKPAASVTVRNNGPPTMAEAPVCLSLDQLPNRPKGLACGAGRVIPARPPYCLI
jgi:hypothetical protein